MWTSKHFNLIPYVSISSDFIFSPNSKSTWSSEAGQSGLHVTWNPWCPCTPWPGSVGAITPKGSSVSDDISQDINDLSQNTQTSNILIINGWEYSLPMNHKYVIPSSPNI